MSQEHEVPDDPHEQRLADIERQLRKARPVPPRLDLATIETLARATSVPTEQSSVEQPRVVLKPPADADRRSWRVRNYGAVAGSWICGALVGAVAMFLYGGRSAPDVAPRPPTSVAKDSTTLLATDPQRMPDDLRSAPGKNMAVADYPDLRHQSWLASAELMSPNGHGHQRHGRGSSTWHVGMCLPSLTAASRGNVDSTVDTRFDAGREWSASGQALPRATQHDLESTPDVTRQRLLRELLGNAAGPIL